MASDTQALVKLLTTLDSPPPASCRAEPVDFNAAGLSNYTDKFAVMIHDLLTPSECDALLQAAEASNSGKWDGAMVNVGNGQQELVTDVRLCDRIIWDDIDLAGALMRRINPHIPPHILNLADSPGITGAGPTKRKETWQATRLNERLRFLKYTPGMYFREHCDGSYVTPDGQEISFLTIHLYLNGQESGLQGGATRFFGSGWPVPKHYDVDPAKGACLVFQHRGLLHSGEEVAKGTKYTVRTDVMYRKVAVDGQLLEPEGM